MKITLLCLFVLLFMSLTNVVAQRNDFAWLLGRWKIKDKNAYEEWKTSKESDNLTGRSYRVKETDTLVTESIVLVKEGSDFYYVPTARGNAGPVKFKLTSHDDKSFVAENPQHDFPKLIRYKFIKKDDGDVLDAAIEGDGKVIQYTFVRVQ